MTLTIDYYNQNAAAFLSATQNADMHLTQDRFLSLLPEHGSILDFGCGSGRDTKYFLEKGFQVTAIDGSAELCRLASEYTGIEVQCMLFEDLEEIEAYDGIWACASILHLSQNDLIPVLIKMKTALKRDGFAYISFKYGTFEGEKNGRFFINFTEKSFRELLKQVPELIIKDCWITDDVRPGRADEKWLNLLLTKNKKGE